jgi:hypothetical protein
MIEDGELGPPSIPIQVPDASRLAVGWTVGTTQSAETPVNVVPPVICPDQLVDSAVYVPPDT